MDTFSGLLEVNLSAIRHNWLLLQRHFAGRDCGAVVKANAYGLGYAPVTQTLFSAGCRSFFVASFGEAVALKKLLGEQIDVYVLQGCPEGVEREFTSRKLIPVLVSWAMLKRWIAHAESAAPFAIKVNTGMNRLGLSIDELSSWLDSLTEKPAVPLVALLSHMACADEPEHPLNDLQRQRFADIVERVRARFPSVQASLCNSAALFLGNGWHFDLARPGIALYGGREGVPSSIDIRPVVSLALSVIQTRYVLKGECIGYGATYRAERDMHVALVAGGYADGILRSLSGAAVGVFRGHQLPLLGRVSMDSCVFDISSIPSQSRPSEGHRIKLLGGDGCDLTVQAGRAGTISYELLTRLGGRLQKHYVEL